MKQRESPSMSQMATVESYLSFLSIVRYQQFGLVLYFKSALGEIVGFDPSTLATGRYEVASSLAATLGLRFSPADSKFEVSKIEDRSDRRYTKSQQLCTMTDKSFYANQLRQAAAFLGTTGVGLGALGAHALHKTLVKRGMLEPYKTANLYQLFHACALVGMASLIKNSPGSEKSLGRAGQLMAVGSTMFSGSIYLLCFGIGPSKIIGPITPIGGFLMLGGWICLGLAGYSTEKED